MIKTLEVKNFKSIKHLKIDCKRVNVFIGEPNTGKSNILESLGVFSLPYGELGIMGFFRYEQSINIFHQQDSSQKIEIIADKRFFCEIVFGKDGFIGKLFDREIEEGKPVYDFKRNDSSGMEERGGKSDLLLPFKFYRFWEKYKFKEPFYSFLLPPDGRNLLALLQTNKKLRRLVGDLFKKYGLKVVLRPYENKIEVQREIGDLLIHHPYSLVSDTLQRVVFHLAAIETNKDSILIFEEPESHSFPPYIKYLSELIADDESNQYFISTHSPDVLISLVEKTPKKDIGIFITYFDFEDYRTKVKPLKASDLEEVLDLEASAFFNLDLFLGRR